MQETATAIFSTAFFELLIDGNQLTIRSSLLKEKANVLELEHEIKDLCTNETFCWLLLKDGSIWRYNFNEKALTKQLSADCECVNLIACTSDLFCITSKNHLIKISEEMQQKIHEFARHQKIKKIAAGAEHCLFLTTNGDIYSLGCGLRGALGCGDVNSCETPKQVEGLAGLKIIDIACGSFHSVAISAFGDVYTFGWNTHGQLGIPKTARDTFENAFASQQQVFTSPQLIDFDEDLTIKEVHCGSKHTILRTEENRIFSAGLNSFGQLGISLQQKDVGRFTEVGDVQEATKIYCGFWSTYFIDFKKDIL